jgi:hypothetical protein
VNNTLETNSNKIEKLKNEIEKLRYDIYVDSYPMSLLELINLYKEGDINLKSKYQRVFKWDNEQRTKLIESFFLGLPIPSIFLYQDENALWEVVDGIQRLSTIFQFVGALRKDENSFYECLKLTKAPKLKYLEGLTYNDLSQELQREFKKFKLQLIIISKKSGQDVKLEVFRRLNGFGTNLNRQELRNALVLLLEEKYFNFIDNLANYNPFLSCFKFKDEQIKDKKHYEYVIRYLTLREEHTLLDFSTKDNPSIDDLFDEVIIEIVENNKINLYDEQILFKRVFILISEMFGYNAFKKFYFKTKKHKGIVRESIFEVIIPGLCENINYFEEHKDELKDAIYNLYRPDSEFQKVLLPNPKAIDRMKKLLSVSKEYFNKIVKYK